MSITLGYINKNNDLHYIELDSFDVCIPLPEDLIFVSIRENTTHNFEPTDQFPFSNIERDIIGLHGSFDLSFVKDSDYRKANSKFCPYDVDIIPSTLRIYSTHHQDFGNGLVKAIHLRPSFLGVLTVYAIHRGNEILLWSGQVQPNVSKSIDASLAYYTEYGQTFECDEYFFVINQESENPIELLEESLLYYTQNGTSRPNPPLILNSWENNVLEWNYPHAVEVWISQTDIEYFSKASFDYFKNTYNINPAFSTGYKYRLRDPFTNEISNEFHYPS
jgi:hypothetical protein